MINDSVSPAPASGKVLGTCSQSQRFLVDFEFVMREHFSRREFHRFRQSFRQRYLASSHQPFCRPRPTLSETALLPYLSSMPAAAPSQQTARCSTSPPESSDPVASPQMSPSTFARANPPSAVSKKSFGVEKSRAE